MLQWTELPFENGITWPPPAKRIPPSQSVRLWFIYTWYHSCPLPTYSFKLLSTSVWSLCENQSGMQHFSVNFHVKLLPSKEWSSLLKIWNCCLIFNMFKATLCSIFMWFWHLLNIRFALSPVMSWQTTPAAWFQNSWDTVKHN